jgi:tetratricopeptide (TPR) repeat protein
MNEDITEKRVHDLEDNIHQDLDLLKEYEDELRYARDPRRMAEYRREIERQHESLTRNQKEYDELSRQMTPEELQNVTELMQQKDAKLDEIRKLLPPIWNVSQHRNPNFTGREGILKALRLALTLGEPAAWKQAITGMGGVGKTQLAVEYIYRHKVDYRIIWWVRSEEPTTMAADYASLAVDLNLPEKDSKDQTEIAKAVKRWLEHNPGWLLIFDNAQDPGEIRNYLPQGGAGHVIITSRNPLWGTVAKLLPARVFERAESIEFLCKRTGLEDKKAADALADELGDLPLGLEQAGAYIETTGIALTAYQELFQSRRKELWMDESHPPNYTDSVATTWSLAMEQVSHESQEAADLLNMCAFLAPDDISLELLSGGAKHLPEPLAATATDNLAMNRAIKALRQYSLIDTSGEGLSLHRLVQAVVRDRLSEDDRKGWTETVVRLLSSAFPFDSDDVRTWHQSSRLLPHALAAAAHAGVLEVAPEVRQHILNQTGVYLRERAEFVEAKVLFERALSLAEKAYGPDHPEVAAIVNNLGLVLQALGDLQVAKEHFVWALKIDEEAYGPDHPNVALHVNNLGGVLYDLGDLQGAKEHFVRALKIDEEAYGPDHPNVARDVNNIGLVLKALGDLKGAKEHFVRALKIDEEAYGPDHPLVATDVNNLGLVLKALGDLKGAKEHFVWALKINEEAYGSDHPNVALHVNNLGGVLYDLGDLQGAKEHFVRALKIDEKAYGPDHPKVATDVNNLGSVLQALGDLKGAKEHIVRALKIDEEAYGPDHPDVARDVNNLGSVLRALGDLKGAKEHFERALAIFRKSLGEDHPSTATVRNNLELLANV